MKNSNVRRRLTLSGNLSLLFIPLCLVLSNPVQGQKPGELVLMTASGHPMQYYLSLPRGWSAGKKWKVVVSSESSEKAFQDNALQFMEARADMPFIIVVPFTVTTSRAGHRTSLYNYSEETWNLIDRVGVCQFTMDGLGHVLRDVQTKYNGEEKIYITGLEAGAHLVFAMTFNHPEQVLAAAPVACNYIGRCVEESSIPANAGSQTKIHYFIGDQDSQWIPNTQWDRAKQLANTHGFSQITESTIRGKGHEKMAGEVLAYFLSVGQK